MNLIIPMAGMGKRMRPHTLTMPKPLFKIAGKTIVERLIEDISKSVDQKIDNIGFVVGRFGEEIEQYLLNIADRVGSKGYIYYQDEALGTAHAVYMGYELLNDSCIIAFADTLFKNNEKIKNLKDNIIWTYQVDDPAAYGVVKKDSKGIVQQFIEKPSEPVSNEAIIGIYYFENGSLLRDEISDIINKNIRVGNEYQLTTVLENLKNRKEIFRTFNVEGWYDCGNKTETLKTNQHILDDVGTSVFDSVKMDHVLILDPVYIGHNVQLSNTIIGPHVSIEENTVIKDGIIRNAIIKENTTIDGLICSESIIGNNVNIKSDWRNLNVGDYTNIE